MLYVCARSMSILAQLIIFIMMLEKYFVSKKSCQFAILLKSTTKSISVEIHWSIRLVEQYYVILRQAYKIIIVNL